MTLYMLDYIDDEGMRKMVHRSLNQGGSFHQIRAAIARISSKKLAGKIEIDLKMMGTNNRLFASHITAYSNGICKIIIC